MEEIKLCTRVFILVIDVITNEPGREEGTILPRAQSSSRKMKR